MPINSTYTTNHGRFSTKLSSCDALIRSFTTTTGLKFCPTYCFTSCWKPFSIAKEYTVIMLLSNVSRYSRMGQLKFLEDSLQTCNISLNFLNKTCTSMVLPCCGRSFCGHLIEKRCIKGRKTLTKKNMAFTFFLSV